MNLLFYVAVWYTLFVFPNHSLGAGGVPLSSMRLPTSSFLKSYPSISQHLRPHTGQWSRHGRVYDEMVIPQIPEIDISNLPFELDFPHIKREVQIPNIPLRDRVESVYNEKPPVPALRDEGALELPLDPEYEAIVEEYDRRKEIFTMSHRDLQWHCVAVTLRGIDLVEYRLALIETVHKFPLWKMLPATVAISPKTLKNWNKARALFLEKLESNFDHPSKATKDDTHISSNIRNISAN